LRALQQAWRKPLEGVPVPNIYFVLFELVIYIQFAICFTHAWKQGTANLLRLFAGIVYGVTLELATIRQLNAYQYGHFLIMVLDVPLCIGVAWDCFLYSVMEFSNASSLPYFVRPVLDGLLALNIDLALDAVAIRFGFWDWGQGLTYEYFGVPYANFWAWFWVIFFFSLGYRLLARRNDATATWISPVLAFVIGLIGVLATNAFITFVIPWSYSWLAVSILLISALICLITFRPRFYVSTVPSLTFWVPFLTHTYILIAGLVAGVILNPIALLWIGLLMSAIAFYLHWATIEQMFIRMKQMKAI
jgi:hypothetical protein